LEHHFENAAETCADDEDDEIRGEGVGDDSGEERDRNKLGLF
jgi:hypothetical protein